MKIIMPDVEKVTLHKVEFRISEGGGMLENELSFHFRYAAAPLALPEGEQSPPSDGDSAPVGAFRSATAKSAALGE